MAWNHKCVDPGRVLLDGEWTDVGFGTCQRCRVEHRLYQPTVRPELRVCAPCAQIYAVSACVARDDGDVVGDNEDQEVA